MPPKSPAKRDEKVATPEAQVRAFIAKRDLKQQKLIRALRSALRKRFPTANELAYDYSHSFVLSFSPTENGIDGILALSARADGVHLYFGQGPKLSDPKKLLKGTAKQTRFVALESASQLNDPDIAAFITATVKQAKVPFSADGKGVVMIKGAAAAKRPAAKRPARKATK